MASDDISDEDKLLFRQAMQAVKPLVNREKQPLSPSPVTETRPARAGLKKQDTLPHALPEISLSNYYTDEIQANTTLSHARHGIPSKRFRELKSGAIPWQARLDLHGLTTDHARETLLSFIVQQYQADHRCILIIHGKGSRHGEAPVLKNLVNHWLKQIPMVLAFHSAQPKEGGTGAVYILLKRRREQ